MPECSRLLRRTSLRSATSNVSKERWSADPKLRAAYAESPRRVGEAVGLRVDPEIVRPLWDPAARECSEAALPPVLARYREFTSRLRRRRFDEIAAGVPADPRFARWRERQIYRLNLERGVAFWPNPHIPASLELSHGCSVGCWFCCLSPPKLEDVLRYTPETARLWRGILEVIRDVAGPAARMSICYSGTDPFDNPDYERFADDYASVIGEPPYTSTAIPTRDIERSRRLIAVSPLDRVRFSVLSLGMLSKVHSAFSPEEMLPVIVGLRYEGSMEAALISFAGRARENVTRYRKFRPQGPLIETPSCETGFKFNLVERTIKLTSPCAPSDRWPLGHRVYDEARFETSADVRRIVEDMIDRHMARKASELPVLRFQSCLSFEPTNSGFALVGPHLRQRFEATPEMPFMARLGELVQSGQHSAERATARLREEYGATRAAVEAALDELFRLSVLDDGPA
ncbi:MAG TPA: radical SAM family RiPP maturation amino acid epimerase [Solirubrobacteraceae bacterium]|nr:radical SAM family RiPP maturation amino acid epimerase [Solirubrobacteraceae bacterium]